MPHHALISWSGSKNSALALHHALRDPSYQVTQLLTSVNAHYQRVPMPGVRLGLGYDQALLATLTDLRQQGIDTAIYGDIFLEDLRAYREQQLARVPLRGALPLWQRASLDVLHEFWGLGFQVIVVCVNDRALDASFCGRLLDCDFVRYPPPRTPATRTASTTASCSTRRISASRLK